MYQWQIKCDPLHLGLHGNEEADKLETGVTKGAEVDILPLYSEIFASINRIGIDCEREIFIKYPK